MQTARNFETNQGIKAAEILCVFQGFYPAELGQKGRCSAGKMFSEGVKQKRERGEIHSPRYSSRFALSDYPAICSPKSCQSGGQNLAALCAAAGKNLAAVGSSHSLTESVNLGTVTAAGLVGTLHIGYTS